MEHEIHVFVLPPVLHYGEPVSSSRARKAILAGEMQEAADLLGESYHIHGSVICDASERCIFNWDENKILPANGRYFGTLSISDRSDPVFITVDNGMICVEAERSFESDAVLRMDFVNRLRKL